MMRANAMSAQLLIAVVAALGMLALLIPLPGWLLDLLVSANLAFSLAVFVLALLIDEPMKMGGFPGLLVVSSLARVILVLAIARDILLGGSGGNVVIGLGAVGGQGGWLAGVVVVLALALINLLVISSGMVRVSEVLARFALDALPGRQMAVDTAVADGRLNAEQASDMQQQIDSACAFYGAMDGAARFLRGDCIATLITVAATPVFALFINQFSGGSNQIQHYLQLATGHGLAILLPAVMVGGAGAMVLARGNSDKVFGAEIARELMVHPVAVATACVVLLVTALVLPATRLPLMAMAVTLAVLGLAVNRHSDHAPEEAQTVAEPVRSMNCIRVGLALTHLIEDEEFEAMLSHMRARVEGRLGLPVRPFTVADSDELERDRMAVVVSGQAVARHLIRAGRLLAVGAQPSQFSNADPVRYGTRLLGAWISHEHQERARALGLLVLSPVRAMLWLIEETLITTAHEAFDLQQAAELYTRTEQTHSQAVSAARSRGVDAVVLCRVGTALLAEGIGLHNLVGFVQAVAEVIGDGRDNAEMIEAVRKRFARSICQSVAPDGTVLALQLAPEVAQELASFYHEGRLAIPPDRGAQWLDLLAEYGTEACRRQHPIAVLCDSSLRPAVRTLISDSGQNLVAVSFDELLPDYHIEHLSSVTEADLQARFDSVTHIEER
jgi:flagellar biosynthesis protein FlhA